MVVVYVLKPNEVYKNRIADIEQGRGWTTFLQGFVYTRDRAPVFFKGGSLCAERGGMSVISKGGSLCVVPARLLFLLMQPSTDRLVKVESCILTVGGGGGRK